MVKPSDQFWICVEQMNGGFSRCKFCGYVFEADTSISIIISHLSGVKGCDVDVCEKAPADVQEAAYLAIYGANKKPRAMPSSCHDEANNTPSNSFQGQNSEVEMLEGDLESVPMEVQGMEPEAAEQGGSLLEETGFGRDHEIAETISAEGLVLDHDAGLTQFRMTIYASELLFELENSRMNLKKWKMKWA
uniref:BED-type domain-containing protein n=1 Tax=Salix viminalis TaxID=40686 RepID=A0A6N2MDY8_SALVM